jgi:hypothetical protein
MPFDQKKINGPEVSFSYKQFLKVKDSEKRKEKDNKKRKDTRNFSDHRKIGKLMLLINNQLT